MTEREGEDKNFVVSIHDIARKYDSDFLRRVADKMSELIEEKKRNGGYN